ncbi:MAG: bifunctional diaminohydroxyphosphoribosylaminopyrimidine deaminase/5-amino-6-(5-phosphoribosylamino)uracil reductase RibD [Lishizhenia sp.]
MTDQDFMLSALLLAQKGSKYAAPNPMVGAVIVHNGKVIGQGYHQKCGEAHAEVNAVESVVDKSVLSESTIYVTLEPCAHTGKTPPCADLIVKHKFKRCVVACVDTFSKVAGKGIARLKEAGIEVEVGVLEQACRNLNKRFFTFHEKGRPYIVLKWAETQDGFVDRLPEEREKGINWITQPETKKLVHQWRSEEQAILVGWKTVVNDNPSLTVREVEGKNPHRYIIDPNFKSKGNYEVYTDKNPTTVFVNESCELSRIDNVEFVRLPNFEIETVLAEVKKKNHISLFVEGGKHTLEQFIVSGFWDEARILTGNVSFNKGLKAPAVEGERTVLKTDLKQDKVFIIHNQ